MASVQDAVENYCKAMMAMDIATLMGSMTPEALGKAMALQGQGPQPGGGLQRYEIAEQGQEGDEYWRTSASFRSGRAASPGRVSERPCDLVGNRAKTDWNT
jgi:hypothetical protein